MGCAKVSVRGALVHTFPIRRSGSFYNSVFVQHPQAFGIEDAEQVFSEGQLPFSIVLPRLASFGELGKSLEKKGYSLAPPWTLMVHEKSIGSSSLDVKVMEIDSSKLRDWFQLQDAFAHVESSRPARLNMVKKVLEQKEAHLLLADLQGRSVGAGLLFIKDGIASIHMIATLAQFRKRGVATTVTLEAIRRAMEFKSRLVWLRTRRGGIGEKVYRQLGFTIFSDILSYTKTPECEDSNLPPQ